VQITEGRRVQKAVPAFSVGQDTLVVEGLEAEYHLVDAVAEIKPGIATLGSP
jgi:hypothetical protein